MSSNIRDAVAEAIWAAIDDDPDDPTPWEDCPEDWKQVTREQADAAIAAHLEAQEQAAHIESDRVDRVRAICREALTDYVDEGEPVLAQYILDALDGKES